MIGKLLWNMGASPPIDDYSTARLLQDREFMEDHDNAEEQIQAVEELTDLTKRCPKSLAIIARNSVYTQLRLVCGEHNINAKRNLMLRATVLPETMKRIIADQ